MDTGWTFAVARLRAHLNQGLFFFKESWPTHIAIDDCRHIEIRECEFEDATFAIGAAGVRTKSITIDNCSWLQDPVPGRLWNQIPWFRVHGAPPDDPPVDINADWRLFDGDFFRSQEIAGGVTISNCRIGQAFNAIHGFNERRQQDLNRDFRVHDCLFFEIRDNVLEPELMASNWWFHHNRIMNVHKWFSLEMRLSRYHYIISNLAWFNSIQGSAGDGNRSGGVFKPTKVANAPFGPIYVFNNSFVTRSDYARKGILAGLKHGNNAIHCVPKSGQNFDRYPDFFGDLSAQPSDVTRRFVTDWQTYQIEMAHDVVGYPNWPAALVEAGYPIDPSSLGRDPRFLEPESANQSGEGLKLASDSPCHGRGGRLEVAFENGGTWTLETGSDVGAWQGDNLLAGPEFEATKA